MDTSGWREGLPGGDGSRGGAPPYAKKMGEVMADQDRGQDRGSVRKILSSLALLITLAVSLGAGVKGEEDVVGPTFTPFEPVIIGSKDLAKGAIPRDLPAEVLRKIEEFRGWAKELELSAFVTAKPPCVLFTDTSERQGRWFLYLMGHTMEVFRGQFHLNDKPMHATAVMHVDKNKEYVRLINLAIERKPYLESWRPLAQKIFGFSIFDPELVTILEGAGNIPGKNFENTLVHLCGHLYLYQYFSAQPFWVREGVALDLEVTVLDKMFAFCAGGQSSPMTRPGGWHIDARKAMRKSRSLDLEYLTSLKQQEFDKTGCLTALGVVHYLSRHRREDFQSFLRGVRGDAEGHMRKDLFYLPPPKRQIELLTDYLGLEWDEATLDKIQAGLTREEVDTEQAWRALDKKSVAN